MAVTPPPAISASSMKPRTDAGQPNQFHFKLLTWNTYGIAYRLKTSAVQFLNNFDLFGITETWALSGLSLKNAFKGHHVYPVCRLPDPKAWRGSGGLCVGVRKDCTKFVHEFICETKYTIWLKLFSGLLKPHKILYGLVYNPPPNSRYANENLFTELPEEIARLKSKYNTDAVIINGDFDARCGRLSETEDLDLDEDNDCFSQNIPARTSRDDTIDKRGERLIQFCQQMGLVILNGRTGKDCGVGEFTCVRPNGRSVNDYVLVTPNLFSLITEFEVGCRTDSDHMPIEWSIGGQADDRNLKLNNTTKLQRLKWKEERAPVYLERLMENESRQVILDCVGL